MIKWKEFSKKQLQLLCWWTENSPFRSYSGIIAEGAVRSGKTLLMSLSFVLWGMSEFSFHNFAICGKTVGSLRRNVIVNLKQIVQARGYKVIDRQADNYLIISKGKTINTFYLFGGRDERSQDLIQGITLAGVLLDEVALMPRSFVEQAMARCSVEGAKFWFNCNPEGPQHWFYVEHILRAKERKYLRIHFDLEDNPSLSEETINRYKNMFSGIFYRRFILGEWAFSDGVIYDCFSKEKNTYTNENRENILPLRILENDIDGGYPWYSSDYGTYNPFVVLEGYKIYIPGDPVPFYYIDNELYYDGRKNMKQKTDEEYLSDLISFQSNVQYKGSTIIDPSASSFITACRKNGINVIKAKNDVEEGIKMVYALLSTGHIKVNSDNCPHLISEFGLYVWDENKSNKGVEVPVKSNDHCLDALRYLVQTTTSKSSVYR